MLVSELATFARYVRRKSVMLNKGDLRPKFVTYNLHFFVENANMCLS